ncbi:MAG: cyclic lactone autoinducer peptide [Lachnospiraceae bacterium]
MLKLLSTVSTLMLVISASDVCFCFFHQPKVPENLEKFSKIK